MVKLGRPVPRAAAQAAVVRPEVRLALAPRATAQTAAQLRLQTPLLLLFFSPLLLLLLLMLLLLLLLPLLAAAADL